MSSPDRLFEMKKTPGLNIKSKRVFCLRSQNRKTLIERRAGSRERQRPKEMTRMLPANIRPFVPIEIIQWDFLSLIFIPRLEYTYIYNQKTTRERERERQKKEEELGDFKQWPEQFHPTHNECFASPLRREMKGGQRDYHSRQSTYTHTLYIEQHPALIKTEGIKGDVKLSDSVLGGEKEGKAGATEMN